MQERSYGFYRENSGILKINGLHQGTEMYCKEAGDHNLETHRLNLLVLSDEEYQWKHSQHIISLCELLRWATPLFLQVLRFPYIEKVIRSKIDVEETPGDDDDDSEELIAVEEGEEEDLWAQANFRWVVYCTIKHFMIIFSGRLLQQDNSDISRGNSINSAQGWFSE